MSDSYHIKKKIADNYLVGISGLSWDDFADINSLHDCENEEDIKEACNERLKESGYPMDLMLP